MKMIRIAGLALLVLAAAAVAGVGIPETAGGAESSPLQGITVNGTGHRKCHPERSAVLARRHDQGQHRTRGARRELRPHGAGHCRAQERGRQRAGHQDPGCVGRAGLRQRQGNPERIRGPQLGRRHACATSNGRAQCSTPRRGPARTRSTARRSRGRIVRPTRPRRSRALSGTRASARRRLPTQPACDSAG